MKVPPKGTIVFGPFRHLPLGQPAELGVDRLGGSNGRHHHEHNKSKPGPRETPGGAAALQGEYRRGGSGDHAEDWHHRIHPKQRPPEINRVLFDWHSPPQIGSLDSENQNSTGPKAKAARSREQERIRANIERTAASGNGTDPEPLGIDPKNQIGVEEYI